MTTYSLSLHSVRFPRKKHERHDIHLEYTNSTGACLTPPGVTGGSSSAFLYKFESSLVLIFFFLDRLKVEWASVLTAPAGLGTVDESGLAPLPPVGS